MNNFWFELTHAMSLWRSYLIHLLLLPLLLASTLAMLQAGLILQQRAMAPMPSAAATSASGHWTLGLQDDSFQTTPFNPTQIRQITTALLPDYQLATLAFSTLSVNDSVFGMQKLSALFLDASLVDFWPGASFIQQLSPDKVLLSHRLARQLLAKSGTLPELMEIDGLYFQVGGVVPANWPGIGHWQADLWFSATVHTTLLRQRLQKQYQNVPGFGSNLSVLLPSLLDITTQFYLLIKQETVSADGGKQLRQRLEQLDLSTSSSTEAGQFSVKITQRPLTAMLLPGVQFLPAMYQKTHDMSRLLIAQASLLFLLTGAQLIILLLARHLQRQSEWRIRTMLGLPKQQAWYAIIAELLPVFALTMMFYTMIISILNWLISYSPLLARLRVEEQASWLQNSVLILFVLSTVFVVLVVLQQVITHYLSKVSSVNALHISTLLQRAGSVIITTGACFSLSLCLFNWQTLQQLTNNPHITTQQQRMHIYALQQAPASYYRSLASDIRSKGFDVTVISAAPLRPITEFYSFTLASSPGEPVELGVLQTDHHAAVILGLELISGRWFREFAHNECVISMRTLKILDVEPENVLNLTLLNELPVIGNCEIVGVVDDLKFGYLNEPLPSVVYKPVNSLTRHLYLISQSDHHHVVSLFKQINSHPAAGIIEQWQLKSLIIEQSERERYVFRLTLLLSIFSILLYLGGLAVEQRLLQKRLGKEAAIRAALGANSYQLGLFLFSDPLKTLIATTILLTLMLTFTLQRVPIFSISSDLIFGNLILLLMCVVTILPLLRQIRTKEIKELLQPAN